MSKPRPLPDGMRIKTMPEITAWKSNPDKETIPPKTYLITRSGIAELFGVSRTKIMLITRILSCDFPAPICRLAHNETAYDMAEALQWLKINNPDTLKFTREQYALGPDEYYRGHHKSDCRQTGFDNWLGIQFLVGGIDRPVKYDPPHKTTTVHVAAVHEHPPLAALDPWLRRGGNHRIAIAGNWD